jgi:uncharacterized membrane protein YphA (DoxX/SURF4 family)
MNYLALIGRILIGLPFAMSGLGKLAAYGPTTEKIAAVGLPFPPLAFAAAVAVELAQLPVRLDAFGAAKVIPLERTH